jgi:hypothetical protein
MRTKSVDLEFKVHTRRLLQEIANHTNQPTLCQPLSIFASILVQVATRASELNDDRLNALMCQLALYDVADPDSALYDVKLVESIIAKGEIHEDKTQDKAVV